MALGLARMPVDVQYMPSTVYGSTEPNAEDPFRHLAGANSHNHHALHPWGSHVVFGTDAFDALYTEANNRFMYHLWYSDALAPYMATELLAIHPLSHDIIVRLQSVLRTVLGSGIDVAAATPDWRALVAAFQAILDDATAGVPPGPVFVRLGATSAKDSFAKGAPTTKPGPLPADDADLVLRRLLTSGRVAGRLLALADRHWASDPGEALVVQRWSPDIELRREVRTFCHAGRLTAISQDIWWEKTGWRHRYSDGFVEAITGLWDAVRPHLPFDTCTMDVLVTPPNPSSSSWGAQVIEFNGFGAHLNTGSDLFHWVRDADVLEGRSPGVTVRFVDDWEGSDASTKASDVFASESAALPTPSDTQSFDDEEPDWLVLERELQAKYADNPRDEEQEERVRLPLRGRWCSAY